MHVRCRLSVDTASDESCNCHGRTKDPLLCPYINTVSLPPPPYSSFELDGLPLPPCCTRSSPAHHSLLPPCCTRSSPVHHSLLPPMPATANCSISSLDTMRQLPGPGRPFHDDDDGTDTAVSAWQYDAVTSCCAGDDDDDMTSFDVSDLSTCKPTTRRHYVTSTVTSTTNTNGSSATRKAVNANNQSSAALDNWPH